MRCIAPLIHLPRPSNSAKALVKPFHKPSVASVAVAPRAPILTSCNSIESTKSNFSVSVQDPPDQLVTASETSSFKAMLATIERADKAISRTFYDLASKYVPRTVFMLLEEGGDGIFWLTGTILLCLFPGLPAYEQTVVYNLFLGLWVDLAFIGSSKAIFRRPRPEYNAADMHVVAAVDNYSFPSGHASRVGFVIAYIFCCYGETNPTICAFFVLWGLLTASSRALMGRHYLGDVFAGLMLGLLSTAVVTKGSFSLDGCWISADCAAAAHAYCTGQLYRFAEYTGIAGLLHH